MLQSLRNKANSWIAYIIIAIIAFMMASTGLETLAPNRAINTVAVVDGQAVTQEELNQAVEHKLKLMVHRMGDKFDYSSIDTEKLKKSALDELIDKKLLLADFKENQMNIAATSITKEITQIPEFQVSGSFSYEQFQKVLKESRMTLEIFRKMIAEEMAVSQLNFGISSTEFITKKELQYVNELEGQLRDFSWAIKDAEYLNTDITVSASEIKEYYDNNLDNFQSEEMVSLDYIELSQHMLAKNQQVSKDLIQDTYERMIMQLKEDAQNNAKISMISIDAKNKRTKAEAQTIANDLVAKLKAGANFSTLAKKYSDDEKSAKAGGNLGIIPTKLFNKNTQQAISQLAVGEISSPQESAIDFQIFTVTERSEVKLPTLASLQAAIIENIQKNQTEALFLEKSHLLADTSFESTDLNEPAELLDLTIQKTPLFSKKGGEEGIASNPQIIKIAFSDDVLLFGANSDIIELSPDRVLVLRVNTRHLSEQKALDVVQEEIKALLVKEKKVLASKKLAKSWVKQLKTGNNTLEQLSTTEKMTHNVSLKTSRHQYEIPSKIMQALFKMPKPSKEQLSITSIVFENASIGLLSLNKVHTKKANPINLKHFGYILTTTNGKLLFNEYLSTLKHQSKIDIHSKST